MAGIRTVVDTYQNGANWYRKWSDGFIEQGGRSGTIATDGIAYTLNFLQSFTNTNYFLTYRPISTSAATLVFFCLSDTNRTVSSAKIYAYSTYCSGNYWYACGY
jgi:hypothetical protein